MVGYIQLEELLPRSLPRELSMTPGLPLALPLPKIRAQGGYVLMLQTEAYISGGGVEKEDNPLLSIPLGTCRSEPI